ncbi:aldo/keto reductase [Paenarthrobacter aurescens]|uniref:Oxidoreductase n=1 Tax=Paenarthrobacter aurescens TaxID=43663 RepID=A0A4Y3NB57_PAEAU|nr:aldo/keto reductase [Paenarthrobacter aurescens]MDO6141932.1 aldo/keto reductase [Paenarthrobacter aurescens]MDO6145737.1 aldo/keto reductase [Paenarthrobacter aurescens]MDO6156981.1 aldo/keto reductase [Paenarthrobacter aurescens]MDO6160967.1 aldo/keto reductase [Paenarthrobacter aurescens]GEB19144.1 oxidoreductase [Paenarthrobacter aurescens]
MTLAPLIELNDGNKIPQLGLGTWPLNDAQVADAVVEAVSHGYRHVDTAKKYGNEKGVGKGIRACGLNREELFITTKLDGEFQGSGKAVAGLDGCLERLGLEYVDLLLIHWPLPRRGEFVSTWKTFEELQASGKAHSIGVSNFKPAHLDQLFRETDIVPAVNQIQISPSIPRPAARAFNDRHGIVTESYSPLGAGSELLNAPVLEAVGAKHGKTPGQVVLRWHVQQGLVAIPKTANPQRMKENLDIFDFELDQDDLTRLQTLDAGPDAGVDSDVQGH